MEGEGFEPSKAEPSDLQSDPFDRSGTPPKKLNPEFCVRIVFKSTKTIIFHVILTVLVNNR
jgi:hypothetical protein